MEIAVFTLILVGGLLTWCGLNHLLSGWPLGDAAAHLPFRRETPDGASVRRDPFLLSAGIPLRDEKPDRASVRRDLIVLAAGILMLAAGIGIIMLGGIL